MYEQLIKNDFLDKVVEMLDRLKQDVLAMKETVAVKTETLIWYEGLKLRKVERIAREGDYVRPTVYSESECVLLGRMYGPVNNDKRIKGEDGRYYQVYDDGFNRAPSSVEVFEVANEVIPLSGYIVGSVSLTSLVSSLSENELTKDVNKLKLQTAETMAQVSKEAYEKFKEEALESDLFKKLIKGIEESAESGKTGFLFEIDEYEDSDVLDVFEEALIQVGYRVRNGFPDKYKLRVNWG
ncbi:hypothetical protein [Rummeliibacillus sp. TYF-LIM-RU47]|uniref:hypothetical protein n=1 Tax=Rummeliibacillus sp. TYF-LIM-RU47 TaxID=2608406 RepID=UPI00123C662F|nr:hypothetical protein [Rummeliibacillus sp. TYF-LIM-RU47]